MKLFNVIAILLVAPGSILLAQSCSAVYGQCGGTGWTGATCCASGSTCVANGPYYSQCIPNTSTTTTSHATTSTTSSHTTTTTTTTSASSGGQSGVTTRYWDCCKPSCAWVGNGPSPANSCAADGVTIVNVNDVSACNGAGPAYMCSDSQPWVVNANLSYGFAAAALSGQSLHAECCSCYQLTFTSGPVVGKQMIVQITNTGSDVGSNQFDIAIPGGGVGIYNGCTLQWGAPSGGWGAQYGGVSSLSGCSALPSQLQAGCDWRFGWFAGADNPNVSFQRVTCPSALTAKSGCSQ